MRRESSKTGSEPSHYLFIVNGLEWEPFTPGLEIAKTLAEANIWLGGQRMPYRASYRAGDRVLLYASGRCSPRSVIGDAVIAGETSDLTPDDRAIAAALGLEGFDYRIPLRSSRLWKTGVPLKPMVEQLEFIRDKRNWGLNLRQAAARLPRADYLTIIKAAGMDEPAI